jgi:GntR family transcriptional regulator
MDLDGESRQVPHRAGQWDSPVTTPTQTITPFSSIRIDEDAPTPIFSRLPRPSNSRRGVGTVVAHGRLREQHQEMRSFSEEIRACGGRPESRLIALDLAIPTPPVRDFFELHEQQKVYEVQRVRLEDGEPLALEFARIPERLCPGLERFDLARSSLYEILEQSYGLRPETCDEEISAEIPSSQQRKLLSLPARTAVLVINRKAYSEDGRPLELTRSVYRGDRYGAIVHSVRKNKSILPAPSS